MRLALMSVCVFACAGLSFFTGLLYSENLHNKRIALKPHPGFRRAAVVEQRSAPPGRFLPLRQTRVRVQATARRTDASDDARSVLDRRKASLAALPRKLLPLPRSQQDLPPKRDLAQRRAVVGLGHREEPSDQDRRDPPPQQSHAQMQEREPRQGREHAMVPRAREKATRDSRPPPNSVIVTGLFDIGRGEWWLYRRPYSYYLKFLKCLLRLRHPMIVFIEPKGADFVRQTRAGLDLSRMTKVVEMELGELELYRRFKANASALMEREAREWRPEWDAGVKVHPEAKSADYDLVVNSKPFLLSLAARMDPFRSEFLFWMDSGYGHGDESLFPKDGLWRPEPLVHQEPAQSRISIITLVEPDFAEMSIEDLYRQDRALVSGGFFGGRKDKVFELYHRYTELFTRLLRKGFLDDDQTVMLLLMKERPELFNAVKGDWFDGLVRFSHRS